MKTPIQNVYECEPQDGTPEEWSLDSTYPAPSEIAAQVKVLVDFVDPGLLNEFIAEVKASPSAYPLTLPAYTKIMSNNNMAAPAAVQTCLIAVATTLSKYRFNMRYTCKWLKLATVRLMQGMDSQGVLSEVTTHAFSYTSESSLAYDLGVSVSAEFGGGLSPATFSATVSASFGETFTRSTSLTDEVSIAVTTPAFVATQDCIVDVWQRVNNYQILQSVDNGTWTPLSTVGVNTSDNVVSCVVFPETAVPTAAATS